MRCCSESGGHIVVIVVQQNKLHGRWVLAVIAAICKVVLREVQVASGYVGDLI